MDEVDLSNLKSINDRHKNVGQGVFEISRVSRKIFFQGWERQGYPKEMLNSHHNSQIIRDNELLPDGEVSVLPNRLFSAWNAPCNTG